MASFGEPAATAANIPCFKGAQILRYIICGLLTIMCLGQLTVTIWISSNLQQAGQWADVGKSTRQFAVCELGGQMSVLEKEMTWYEAEKWCKNGGSRLVEIVDASHNEKVKSMCDGTKFKPHMCHIGLKKTQTGVWQWSTSQKTLAWKNWALGEPNNLNKDEDKGAILTQKGSEMFKTITLIVVFLVLGGSIITLIVAASASICVIKGLRQQNRCYVVSATITDGVCACCIISGGVNTLQQPGQLIGGILGVLSGIPLVVASVIGCSQCSSVQPANQGTPQQVTIVGQPVPGANPS